MQENSNTEPHKDSAKVYQLAFVLPASPDTTIYLFINNLANATMILLATTSFVSTNSTPALGNLVYAIPNRLEPSGQPLSTTLYSRASSLDFASRLARVLAKKLNKPVYVGGEVKLWVEEDEAVALRGILDIVMKTVDKILT